MKIALAHDYLTQLGGAEKVLSVLQDIFPGSPLFVLLYNRDKTGDDFPPHKVRTSWLQRLPWASRRHHWYLAFMPAAAESLPLRDYDLIISSASSFAKGIIKDDNCAHICYCHTPTRYLWHDFSSYIDDLSLNPLIKKIVPFFLPRLRHWDFFSARRVDYFIANSAVVSARIAKYYERPSKIIYPPVETEKFYCSRHYGDYYLIGGRLVAYKKYDLAIRAFNKLGIKLKIFGQGPDSRRLRRLSAKNIEFLGSVSDSLKAELMSHCRAFIYPQVEDFGITAVEAMASGRPVIAFAGGGARETVLPGLTGEFFEEQIWEALAHQVIHFRPDNYNQLLIREHAEKFSAARFQREITSFIFEAWQDFCSRRQNKNLS